MSDDLLAGGEAADNQTPETPTDDGIDHGPPPATAQYPEWVPPEFHAPEKRAELLQALSIDTGKQLPTERPENLPEKFWDDERGLQLDKLVKSYGELEKKLGTKAAPVPEAYEVKLPDGVELPDGEPLSEADVELFKELGLGNEQAQKLVDHFWSQVMPMVAEQQTNLEITKLAAAWNFEVGDEGPPAEFKERLGAVRQWAESNLPKEVVDNLRKSASGVQALWAMMQNKVAPANTNGGVSSKTDAELQAMVNDPRYWDPANDAYRQSVQAEFERRAGRG